MNELIDSAPKELLVQMVKLTQKKEMKGSKGDWKEFLNSYDKQFGSSLLDPSRRSVDALSSFMKTFEQDEDVKLFKRVLKCHSNRQTAEQFKDITPDETAEQGLVRLTLLHPQYPIEYSFPSYEEKNAESESISQFKKMDWVVVKCSKKTKAMKSTKLIAIDCEMVLCEDGTEALVKVCAVDRDLKVRLVEVVNPNKAIADYRTEITGISAKDLDGVTTSLEDVQIPLKKLLSHGTILVGHSVNNDLQVLKLDHTRVIDTSYVFKYANAPYKKPSLRLLCKSLLGFELRQEGNSHDCVDDACAAMKLVLARVEGKIDTVITDEVKVLDADKSQVKVLGPAKLLVHMIPTNISSEDLKSILYGDFSIEVKVAKKPGKTYSAFAVFKSDIEANDFFENLKGDLEKNTYGKPQKLVKFELDSGKSGSLYVCSRFQRKRSAEDDDPSGMFKKLLTDRIRGRSEDSNQVEVHLREIQRLKDELSRRDEEILNLSKVIASLARKQGI